MKTTALVTVPLLCCMALTGVGMNTALASTVDFNSNTTSVLASGGTINSGTSPDVYSFSAPGVLAVLTLDPGVGVFNETKSLVFLNAASLAISRVDNGLFSLSGLDVGFTSGFLDPSEQLKITGHSGSGDVSITTALSKTSFANISTPSFNNLTSLTLSVLGNTSSPGYVAIDNLHVTAVPEPETYAMFLAGLALIAHATRRRRRA